MKKINTINLELAHDKWIHELTNKIIGDLAPVLQPVSCEIFPSSSLLSQAAIYAKVNRSKVLT